MPSESRDNPQAVQLAAAYLTTLTFISQNIVFFTPELFFFSFLNMSLYAEMCAYINRGVVA